MNVFFCDSIFYREVDLGRLGCDLDRDRPFLRLVLDLDLWRLACNAGPCISHGRYKFVSGPSCCTLSAMSVAPLTGNAMGS